MVCDVAFSAIAEPSCRVGVETVKLAGALQISPLLCYAERLHLPLCSLPDLGFISRSPRYSLLHWSSSGRDDSIGLVRSFTRCGLESPDTSESSIAPIDEAKSPVIRRVSHPNLLLKGTIDSTKSWISIVSLIRVTLPFRYVSVFAFPEGMGLRSIISDK